MQAFREQMPRLHGESESLLLGRQPEKLFIFIPTGERGRRRGRRAEPDQVVFNVDHPFVLSRLSSHSNDALLPGFIGHCIHPVAVRE